VRKEIARATDRVLQQMYVKRALEKVKDADIKRAYEQFKQNYPKGKERSVGHILLDNKSDPQGQAAQSALDSILKGESFEKIAKERSLDRASAEKEGGKIGWIRTDQAPEELREAINATKVGGVFAKLVKTEYGWHIIKVYEERDSVPPAFDEIKDLIRFKVAEGIVRQQLEKFASVAKIELFDLNGQPEKAPVNPADTAQKAG
jgi:peptidyl-prolyl cis-trans isomerase C